ncbi:oxidoreductase [Serratia ureilytica]|nr:oxidoreductase [Serratia ureilytica]
MICGYWRLMEWGMSPQQLLTFIEQHVELGVTTVDHADIYGGYACEQAFGDALRLKPALRQSLELVSKCGIATTAKPGNPIGHYITDRDHIVQSAEHSLRYLHTDYLDLLLIPRPDPLMDADDVAEAFVALHKSGRCAISASLTLRPRSSNCCSRVCRSLWSPIRWKFRRFTNRRSWTGTLDQCQQLRIKPMAWSCLGGAPLVQRAEFQPLRESCCGWRKDRARDH